MEDSEDAGRERGNNMNEKTGPLKVSLKELFEILERNLERCSRGEESSLPEVELIEGVVELEEKG